MQKPDLRLRAGKLRILKQYRIWPTLEICGCTGPPIPKVPCLYQINVYIKRKLRVWGTQKCNFLVGAETVRTVMGRQTAYSQAMPYVANIGNLRQFGATNPQGTVFAPNQCLYQKEATGVGNPKSNFLIGSQTVPTVTGPQTTFSQAMPYMANIGICGSSGPPIPKVPCFHQINVYIKRKLRVWGTQKCNFLIGAETVLTVTGRQTTYS